MGTFSILFRMVLRSTPPIFSFVLIFSNLFPISTGLLGGLGARCELPQRGLGRSPIRNRILCILALKYDIWWQQF